MSSIAGQLVASFVAEALVLGGVDGLGLFEDLARDLLIGAVLSVGGVGLDAGAVEGDRSDADEPGLGAEDQDLAEELGE